MAIDDEQQILHWRGGAWHQIAWSGWLRFRGLTKPLSALPGVGEGVHHFVICTTEDGRFLNAVPHCYRVDQDGRIADDGNGGLSDIEDGSYRP